MQIATLCKHCKNCELCHSLNVNHFHQYLKNSKIKKNIKSSGDNMKRKKSHWFDRTRSLSSTQHSLVKLWKHFVSVIECSVLSTEAFRVSAANRQTQCSADKIRSTQHPPDHQITRKAQPTFWIVWPKLAYGWQGLECIVGPKYSFRVFSTSGFAPAAINLVELVVRIKGYKQTNSQTQSSDVTNRVIPAIFHASFISWQVIV